MTSIPQDTYETSQIAAHSQRSRYDDFIDFLDNVEIELSQKKSNLNPNNTNINNNNTSQISIYSKPQNQTADFNDTKSQFSNANLDPRTAYSKVRERLLELELEREEQANAV